MKHFRDSRIWRLLAAAVFAVFGLSTAGHAKTMQQKMQAACSDDIARLCPAEAAGDDRLKVCMLKHRAHASAACMAFFDNSE